MTNLAYDYSLEETTIVQEKEKPVRKERQVTKTNVGKRIMSKAFFLVLVVCISSVNILINYSTLANVKNSVELKKRQNTKLEKEIKLMEARLEEIISAKAVEEIATEQLGMFYPSEEDKIYINSREQEYVKEKPKKEIGFMGLFTK